jgi:hypothetical protein
MNPLLPNSLWECEEIEIKLYAPFADHQCVIKGKNLLCCCLPNLRNGSYTPALVSKGQMDQH